MSNDARLERMRRSPQWQDGRFRNRLPRIDAPLPRILREFFFGGSRFRRPAGPIPVERRTAADFAAPPATGLRVTWLGHSTLLLEVDGRRVLIDPVWGERASPVPFVGPERWYAPPLRLAELPPLDAVVISHDHYDHLDRPTVEALATVGAARGAAWVVPLGVGAHLKAWGVSASRITELDWWESVRIRAASDAAQELTITATPARHFSGRGIRGRDRTLWAGWAFQSASHRVFYSGDTALHEDFVEIGERLGPFDLTMIEIGAYDAMWADVHIGPEQAVLAHRLVRGGVMLPVHWGLFDLALHGWTEPIERVLAAAAPAGIHVATPRPGGMVEPGVHADAARWWPAVPWKAAAEAPLRSSAVGHVVGAEPATRMR
jgi:L-ascorbate metabolism protein UlaG (beta-lactamase superfamily)